MACNAYLLIYPPKIGFYLQSSWQICCEGMNCLVTLRWRMQVKWPLTFLCLNMQVDNEMGFLLMLCSMRWK
jgi:hypothetical protein